MMEKDRIIELWQDQLVGAISEQDEQKLKEALQSNEALASELKEMEQTWGLFEEIARPEPSEKMDGRFEGMLAAYAEGKHVTRPSLIDVLLTHLSQSWQTGLAMLLLGLLIGWWMLPSQDQQNDINQLSSEIQGMKEMMMLTLIEQPKAQERIRAVNLAAELPKADEKVINALITTLNHDENVNVRMAALESLLRYVDQASVRQALVDALHLQESPLVVVAIADVLVQLQEKSSLETMEQLKEEVEDELVKEKLEQSIQTLRQS